MIRLNSEACNRYETILSAHLSQSETEELPPNFFSALVYKTTLTVVHNFKWLCAVKLTLN